MAKKSTPAPQATPAQTQQSAPATPAPAQQAAPAATTEKKARAPSKKADATSTTAQQSVAPVASTPEQQAAPVKEKKARAPSAKKDDATSAPAQQAASTPAPQASSEQSHEEQPQSVEVLFQTLVSQAEALMETQKTWLATLRRAVKCYTRESREMARANARLAAKRARRQNGGDGQKRAPSGFQIPTSISDNLCDFLGVAHGTKMSRNVVTKQINNYIREHNLQVKENRRSFVPDTKLGDILGKLQDVDASTGFTYFNLQRYISRHFTSSAASATTTSSAH
jgi:chromatin remodeling complex protein RSC6